MRINDIDNKWDLIDSVIKDSMKRYPKGWEEFKKDSIRRRSKFGLAIDKDLASFEWRNTLSFPIFKRGEDENSIEMTIKKIMPDYMSDLQVYLEFCRRYPFLVIPEKI